MKRGRTYLALLLLLLPASLILACSDNEDRAQGKSSSKKPALAIKAIGKFESPVWMTRAPGENVFYIVEQEGRVIRFHDGKKSTWLDIRDRVQSGGEQGLLSLAFSPDYQENGLFYIYYTDKTGRQVVAEGKGAPSGGALGRSVLSMNDFASNHNGGQITFGPGGLYIATGDGGGSGDPRRSALDPRSLLGKMLRILPYQVGKEPYTIPRDNPFYSSNKKRREIFSMGLRNPWRFSFARGRIWIGDVGQDAEEEISAPRIARARGGNFGWSAWEGRLPYNKDQNNKAKRPIWPVFVYGRDQGCSVTGGYFMERLAHIRNRYIYSDFCQGDIRSFALRDGRAVGDRSEGVSVAEPVSFTRAGDKLWVISLGGTIYRLR